jgi:hypothetical protein
MSVEDQELASDEHVVSVSYHINCKRRLCWNAMVKYHLDSAFVLCRLNRGRFRALRNCYRSLLISLCFCISFSAILTPMQW